MRTQSSRKLVVGMSLAVALGLGLPSVQDALAKDEILKEADVPAPVVAAFKKKYPNARADKFEREPGKGADKGKTIYEIKFRDGKKKLEIELTPEGAILAEEEVIAKKDLPEAVRKSFAESEYGKAQWKLKQIEKKTLLEKTPDKKPDQKPDQKPETIFEIEVAAKGEVMELSYDDAGKLLSVEKEGEGEATK